MTRQQTLDRSTPTITDLTEWTDESAPRPTERTGPSPLTEPRFTCASCRVEIRGPATFHAGVAFCCAGCVAGGPCTCSYDPMPGGAE